MSGDFLGTRAELELSEIASQFSFIRSAKEIPAISSSDVVSAHSVESFGKLRVNPDVTSVDFDFFNRSEVSYQRSLAVAQKTAASSKAVFLFFSPVFINHKRGLEICESIFKKLSTDLLIQF